MDDITREYFNTFGSTRDFGAANAADFPKNSAGDVNFKILIAKIPVVEASGALQESNISLQATASKAMAAASLLDYLRKINRTARAAGVDHPEIAELFRMPHGNNQQKLLAAAMAFHTDGAAHESVLIEYGRPADFLAVLQTKINDFEAATTGQNLAKDSQVGATANIDAEMEAMHNALRRLRGIVPNVYENNPAKLAEWKSASHVKEPPKKAPATPDAKDKPKP